MQTNYAPNMSLRNKIVTGVAVGLTALAGVFNGGCMTDIQRTKLGWRKYYDSLSPEQKQRVDEECYNFLAQQYEEQRKLGEEYSAAAAQLSRYNAQVQQQNQSGLSQQNRDSKVIDEVKGRVGGFMATQGLLKAIADHAK